MTVVKTTLETIPLLRVSGELDHVGGNELCALGREQLGSTGRVLLLDLSECTYIDSGGLGALFGLLRDLGSEGVLGLIGVNQDVCRIIEIVGLPRLASLRLFEDAAEATAFFASGGASTRDQAPIGDQGPTDEQVSTDEQAPTDRRASTDEQAPTEVGAG